MLTKFTISCGPGVAAALAAPAAVMGPYEAILCIDTTVNVGKKTLCVITSGGVVTQLVQY